MWSTRTGAGASDRRSLLCWSAVVPGAAVLAFAATFLTGEEGGLAYRTAFQGVASAGVVLAATGAWRHRASLGRTGALIVAAVGCAWIGDLGTLVAVAAGRVPSFPSWTDGFYLSVYLLLMVATLHLVHRRRAGGGAAALIDSLTLTAGIGVLAYAFVISDVVRESGASPVTRLVGALYPVCDILVVGVLVRLLLSRNEYRAPALLLAGALSAYLAGDVGFTLATFAGVSADRWTDAAYLVFFLLAGLAVLHPDAARLAERAPDGPERLGRGRSIGFAAAGLLAPLTLLLQNALGRRPDVEAVALGAIVLLGLTLARMSLLVRAIEHQRAQLEDLARTDPLTRLPNRRRFDQELARASAGGDGFTVAMLDLDRFKAFNDTHGHSVGDDLLVEAADAWSAVLGQRHEGWCLARYGGEEFALVLPGVVSSVAVETLEAVLAATPRDQTFSAGVAGWEGRESAAGNGTDLLRAADEALYAAKAAGRARVLAA